jgi:N-acetylglucosaminyl-diphospho-decaprenol L-rhamnosyltransferase
MSNVSVAIVNWRSPALTIAAVESLDVQRRDIEGLRVEIVDNDSRDGSAAKIRSAIVERGWDRWVAVTEAPRNGGYSYGANLAMRAMQARGGLPDFVFFLNPDTVVRAGALRILVDFMQRHAEVGIAGGCSEDPDGTSQFCCFRFPSALNEFAYYLRLGIFDRLAASVITRIGIPEHELEVDWVSGAAIIVRRAVFADIGAHDEGFFLFYEDTDFILRARRAGWRCWHVPQSRIVHFVGVSGGVTKRDHQPQRLPSYWFESRRRYFVLNHGVAYAVFTDALVIVAHALWSLRNLARRRREKAMPSFVRDFLRHSAIRMGSKGLSPRQTAVIR